MTALPIPKPMLALAASALPAGDDWTYEVKWDGYRTLAVKDGQKVRLISRNLKDATAKYPSVVAAIHTIKFDRVVLDGELVALDRDGRPSFQALQHRSVGGTSLAYYAFDLLARDGTDLMHRPLAERRERLAAVVAGSQVLLSAPLPGTVAQITREVKRLGLEGVVAKRRTSRYEPGQRSGAWVKVRFGLRQEFVVGGYKPDAKTFDSLLVGYFDGRQLYYAGKVRVGFTPLKRSEIFMLLKPIATEACPFVNLPNSTGKSHWGEGVTAEDMKTLRWTRPRLVVEVAFTEWTANSNLRHAAFVGLRQDKTANEVHRET